MLPPLPQSGAGKKISPHNPRGRGTPSRAARSARSPGRPRSPAAGNSRSSPSSRRSAQPGLPRLPEGEPHAGRPRGPPSPPPSTLSGQPRRAGRGPDWPPLPAPRARRNAWQPRPRAILSGSEAAQPRCFRLFPGRRPASPGPRLPADWGVGSRGGANWGTSRPGSGSGPGPGRVRRRSGPALSAEARRADY